MDPDQRQTEEGRPLPVLRGRLRSGRAIRSKRKEGDKCETSPTSGMSCQHMSPSEPKRSPAFWPVEMHKEALRTHRDMLERGLSVQCLSDSKLCRDAT